MKNFLFLLVITFQLQSTIYSVKVQNIDGGNIELSAFANQKVLIVEYLEERPNIAQMLYLDSLQKKNPNLHVIALPLIVEKEQKKYFDLKKIRSQLNLSLLFSKPVFLTKKDGKFHDDLLSWLSTSSEFNRFRNVTHKDGQMFFISNTGVLFGVLNKNAPKIMIQELVTK